MHIVAIHGWQEVTPELAQALANALGIPVFDARQRMIGGGPAVVASFADPNQAQLVAGRVNQGGLRALVMDPVAFRSGAAAIVVRRFELGEQALRFEASAGQAVELPYAEIELLLSATGITSQSQTNTVTERKFSIGKTLLAGGIPMTKQVKREETVTTEDREEILSLYAGTGPALLFKQQSLSFEGLGPAKKLTRDLNFAYLKSELRRRSPQARYDDRLLKRAGQSRLLGPSLSPENDLDLAFEILAQALRGGMAGL
jgi:hypothetical protein